MTEPGARRTEETLDPATAEEWAEFRSLAHRMLDDALDYQQALRAGPAWQPMPEEAKSALREPLPVRGVGAEAAYEAFTRWVLPYNYGNVHPRHWGWVNGQGTPLAVMAELLAATMNPNCWGGEHAPAYVEAQVLAWLREALGLAAEGSGLLVSGGSMANVIGLAAARESGAGADVARRGLVGLGRAPAFYVSAEAHNSLDKAAALLGLGFDAVRRVPVDEEFRMDAAALRAMLREDLAAGLWPFCVVATAGTVNTGAIDPLPALADLCAEHGLWLHVDGAFGALAALSPELRPLVAGLERADSVAFDLHKWMYLPIEIGCILVRDRDAHRRPFAPPAAYLQRFERGLASGEHVYTTYGPQLTRSFRALKAWLCMRAYGMERYGRLVRQNVEQARALAARIRETPELELLAPVPLNVVCFRHRGVRSPGTDNAAPGAAAVGPGAGAGDSDDVALDALNRELLMRLWESGEAAPSGTVVRGRFAIRCAFTNHRTRAGDLDVLLDAVRSIGRTLTSPGPAAARPGDAHAAAGPGRASGPNA